MKWKQMSNLFKTLPNIISHSRLHLMLNEKVEKEIFKCKMNSQILYKARMNNTLMEWINLTIVPFKTVNMNKININIIVNLWVNNLHIQIITFKNLASNNLLQLFLILPILNNNLILELLFNWPINTVL